MTIMVAISADAKAWADELVSRGRFETVEQAVEAGLYALDDDEIDPDAEADAIEDISDEDREAIREGLRDIKEGRTFTAEEVFADLRARFGVADADD